MRRRAAWGTLARNDLRNWRAQVAPWVCGILAVGAALLKITGPVSHSVVRQAVGGPAVVALGGQLRAGPGWTWFLLAILFVVAATGVIDTPDAWTHLAVIRGAPRRRLAGARLAALAAGAALYAVGLLAALGAVALRTSSAPFLQPATLWGVGVWVLGLVSLGWFAQALKALTRQAWPALVVPLILLAAARYGGNVSPYVPFAQWIVALHGLPGTLSVGSGAAYVLGWLVLSGVVAVWAAGRQD